MQEFWSVSEKTTRNMRVPRKNFLPTILECELLETSASPNPSFSGASQNDRPTPEK
jgi:hypothetical protein